MAARTYRLALPLIGAYQASNVLVAAGLAMATAASFESVFSAMQRLAPVRGRLERAVISRAGAPVYVDYAHTADALEAAIAALRPHVSGRLITVFGAGGDRDQGKRPEMGAVASRLSDVVIVTDDNPRGEDPAKIRAEVMAGAPGAIEIGGRREAIAEAIRMAADGRHHPACRQGPRDRADRRATSGASVRRCAGRAGVRARERRSGPLPRSRPRPAARASAAFEVTGVTFDSREVEPGDLFVAMPGTVYDGHKFVAGAFAAGRPERSSRSRSTARTCWWTTRAKALEALGRASRERSAGDDRRRHRIGRQDQHQGSALRRARPRQPRARSIARSRATTTIPAFR